MEIQQITRAKTGWHMICSSENFTDSICVRGNSMVRPFGILNMQNTHRRFLCLEEKQSGEGNNMLILFHHKTGLSSKTLQAIKFLEPNVITVPRTLIQSASCLKVVVDLGTKLKHTSGEKNLVVIWMPVLAFLSFSIFQKNGEQYS